MHQQQTSMFAGALGYSEMISQASAPSPYMGGFNTGMTPGPAPAMPAAPMIPQSGGLGSMAMMSAMMPPSMGFQQGFGEQLAGTMAGGVAGAAGFANNVVGTATGVAGMAAMGMGLAGIPVGGALGLAAGPVGGLVAGGLTAGAFAAGEVFEGVQQRQQVNRVLRNRFGGQMGIGSGAGGRGFSSGEMGDISGMIREMSSNDMFLGVEDLTRVMDSTAQQGLYRGVQGVKQFKSRFRELVGTLKSMAEDMQTTLEGASELMGQQRSMGIFGSQAIEASLTRTRMQAGASGMSMQQMQQIGMQGAAMGRAMGMRGATGARMMQNMAADIGIGMQTGMLSDELMSEATGGLQGAEAAQAMAGNVARMSSRFLNRGAGRVLTAALWDRETGGVNREMMARLQSGELDFNQLRSIARRNIAETGGRRSEFFRDRERITGEVIAEGGGVGILNALGEHYARRRGVSLDDPIMQRQLRRHLGGSQAEIEALVEMGRSNPRIIEERRLRYRQQMENEARTRSRSRTGIQGLQRRIAQIWEREVEAPFNQIGDDLVSSFTDAIDSMANDLTGTIETTITRSAIEGVKEEIRGGRQFMMTRQQMQRYQGGAGRPESLGVMSWAGGVLGTRRGSSAQQLRRLGIEVSGSSNEQEAADTRLRQLNEALGVSRENVAGMFGGDEGFGRVSQRYRSFVLSDMSNAQQGQQSWWEELTGQPADDTMSSWSQRVEQFRQQDAQFAAATEGMTTDERIGVAQRMQREARISGRFALPEIGAGAGDTAGVYAAARSAQDARQTGVRLLQESFNRGAAGEAPRMVARGGRGGVVMPASPVTRGPAQEELERLQGALGANPELLESIRTAYSGSSTEQARSLENLRELSQLNEGDRSGAPGLRDVDLSERQRQTLAQIVTGDDAAVRERLRIMDETERTEQTRLTTARFRETAEAMQTAVNDNQDMLREALGENFQGLRDLVSARTRIQDRDSFQDAGRREQEYFRRLALSDDPNQLTDAAAALRQLGPGGEYMASMATSIARRVQTSRNRRGGGRGRTRAAIEEQLRGAGAEGDLSGLFRGNQLRDIMGGRLSAEEFVEQNRERLGELNVTGAQLTETLQETFRLASTGEGGQGITHEERVGQILRQEQERTEASRLEGGPGTRQDMNEVASQQLSRLEQLVQLTEQSMRESGTSESILRTIASNTANNPGGGGNDATSGQTQNSGGSSGGSGN